VKKREKKQKAKIKKQFPKGEGKTHRTRKGFFVGANRENKGPDHQKNTHQKKKKRQPQKGWGAQKGHKKGWGGNRTVWGGKEQKKTRQKGTTKGESWGVLGASTGRGEHRCFGHNRGERPLIKKVLTGKETFEQVV